MTTAAYVTLLLSGTSAADIITVGTGLDAETIPDALALAADGDELAIASGTWSPSAPDEAALHLTNRLLTIRALDVESPPTFNGGPTGRAVVIDGGTIVLQDLVLLGGSVSGGDINGDGLTSDWERSGGAMTVSEASVTMVNCSLSGGAAWHGGCLGAWSADLSLQNCTISGGMATFFGGGARMHGGSLFWIGGQLDNCMGDTGGGMVVGGGCDLVLTNVVVSSCQATWYGGGLCLDSSQSAVSTALQEVSISSCAAGQSGGGVYIYGGQFQADGVQIDACSAVDGAGIAAVDTIFGMSGGGASANIASGDGGALWAVDSSVDVQSAVLALNEAVYGGAVFLDWCSDASLQSATFDANQAVLRGGALYAVGTGDSDTSVSLCVVQSNTAGLGVDGMVFTDGNAGGVSGSQFCGQSQHVGGAWTDLGGNSFADACASNDCPGDLDDSGLIGLGDVTVLLNAWGACGGDCAGDLDGDGTVAVRDLIALLRQWGQGC
jgi:predicted outer membrane repeat protein